jgi:hypothetical protein
MQVGWLGDENDYWAEIRFGSLFQVQGTAFFAPRSMAGSDGVVRDYGRGMIALTPAAL